MGVLSEITRITDEVAAQKALIEEITQIIDSKLAAAGVTAAASVSSPEKNN